MNKIIFASNNEGKIKEVQSLLEPYKINIISQSSLKIPPIEETALTFVENALLKARHVAHFNKHPVIADDSGLVVTALKGAPGIYSARYAGNESNSKKNIEKLLQELQPFPDFRQAFFYCVLVYIQHEKDPTPIICEARWQGKILKTPSGENGFGYDPIFYVPEYQCSAAELPMTIKNEISHRGQAIKKLVRKLHETSIISS